MLLMSTDKICHLNVEYKEHISRYILKILNVTENDHGTYKCVASNASGFCECNAQLQVTNVKFRFGKTVLSFVDGSLSWVLYIMQELWNSKETTHTIVKLSMQYDLQIQKSSNSVNQA